MPAEFDANQKLNKPEATPPAAASSENDDELMWELLGLYADGEASQEEASQVERMLRHDAEYARAYSFMQKAGSAIRTIVEIEPPAHLRNAILAKTTHRPTFARRAAVVFGAFRAQLAAPVVGRLAFAGGGLAAAALVIGIYAGRTNSSNGINLPAPYTTARTMPPGGPSVASSDSSVPVYVLPDPSEIAKAGTPLPNRANNPVPVTKPNTVPNLNFIPFGPRLAQAGTNVNATPAVKSPKLYSVLAVPKNGTGPSIVENDTTPLRYTEDSNGTQNVNPMMDANVQHRTAPMVIASISPGSGSKGMGTDADDLNDNNVLIVHDATTGAVTNTPDGDSSPDGGRKIVGKLMLSRLPPSSRHLMSPADAIREANNRSLVSYNATSSEETPRRSADVPVLKGSF
jgi:hypothetical protein